MLCYHPSNAYVWDTWCVEKNHEVHLFHLQRPLDDKPESKYIASALGHAVSTDLINWHELPPVLYPAPPGALDDMQAFTGCSYQNGDTNYLFYTMRSSRDNGRVQYIGLATSEDMATWTRYEQNPIIEPDPSLYVSRFNALPNGTVDCRDLMVVEDPKGNGYYGFYAARIKAKYMWQSTAIAVVYSKDLKKWEHLPEPAFVPEQFGLIEVPDVFFLHGKWYMCCLVDGYWANRNIMKQTSLGTGTIYAVADSVEGPYRLNDDFVLCGGDRKNTGYANSSFMYKGTRRMINTERGTDTVSPPMIVYVNDKGNLRLKFDPLTEGYRTATLADPNNPLSVVKFSLSPHFELPSGDIQQNGNVYTATAVQGWHASWLNALSEDIEMSCELDIDGVAAGLCFGDSAFLLDTLRNEVVSGQMDAFDEATIREWPLAANKNYHLRVRIRHPRLEIYVNDELVIQSIVHSNRGAYNPGIIVDRAKAIVKQLYIYRLG
ncbi:MAG: hypothetical protein ACOX63_01760 [Christensenellales bacterium]|jgi:beta-fructofuranosidase